SEDSTTALASPTPGTRMRRSPRHFSEAKREESANDERRGPVGCEVPCHQPLVDEGCEHGRQEANSGHCAGEPGQRPRPGSTAGGSENPRHHREAPPDRAGPTQPGPSPDLEQRPPGTARNPEPGPTQRERQWVPENRQRVQGHDPYVVE